MIFNNLKKLFFLIVLIGLSLSGADRLSGPWYFTRQVKDADFSTVPAGCTTFRLEKNHGINLDSVEGKAGKMGDECIVYTEFTLDRKQRLGFSGAADWWMEIFLNGEKIFTTFPDGNYSDVYCEAHRFSGTGKKGKNLLAVRVRRGRASWQFFIKEIPPGSADPSLPLTVTVDPGKKLGVIKPMNAVNNGPIGSTRGIGNLKLYQEAKIPYARNHDASFCSSYGGEHTVDVHAIFPDFSKDPDDPASYDFAATDRYLKKIVQGGAKVFYRLGSKIEHAPEKYGTRVPSDFKKWAVVCEHIIRHYNEGWANGMKMNIEYWEIWNEYDLPKRPAGTLASPTWQGTDEQFFEFYTVAATHLKKCFPKLKIGGPAVSSPNKTRKFLKGITANGNKPPMDFFSWHIYTRNPADIARYSSRIRELLDQYGYQKAESILNEWNYVRAWQGDGFLYTMRTIQSIKGAAFAAAGMIAGQSAPVDMLMYYDARPSNWNGIFDRFYGPLKTYFVFKCWAKLAELGKCIEVDTQEKIGLFALGAAKNGKTGVLLARFFDDDALPGELPVTFTLKKGDLRGAKLYLLDAAHDLTEIPYRMDKAGNLLFGMKANTVMYLEF